MSQEPNNAYPRSRALQPGFDGSEYGADELEFMLAMERFIRTSRVRFPTASQILQVAKSLGYRKVSNSNAGEKG